MCIYLDHNDLVSVSVTLRWDQHVDLARAWKVTPSMHVIRRVDYRGRSAAAPGDRLRLPFDALTTVGALFAVTRPQALMTSTLSCMCDHQDRLWTSSQRMQALSTVVYERDTGRHPQCCRAAEPGTGPVAGHPCL